MRLSLQVIDSAEKEADKLDKRISNLRPLVEKIENNLAAVREFPLAAPGEGGKGSSKRELELAEEAVEKRCRVEQD